MTKQELIEILEQVHQDQKIAGTVAGKLYTFKGFADYSGKGRYPHLRGTRVVVLQSDERKRGNIALFLEPLLLFVNSDSSKLTHGKLPDGYIAIYCSGDFQGIPNLYDCEGHYKSLARYIQEQEGAADYGPNGYAAIAWWWLPSEVGSKIVQGEGLINRKRPEQGLHEPNANSVVQDSRRQEEIRN